MLFSNQHNQRNPLYFGKKLSKKLNLSKHKFNKKFAPKILFLIEKKTQKELDDF